MPTRFSLRTLLFAVIVIAASCALWLKWHQHQVAQYVPMRDDLARINSEAADDPIGQFEPRLTEDEVIAEIRRQLPTLATTHPGAYAIYERIAATRTVPKSARFNAMNSWHGRGATKPVWWINLQVELDEGAGTGFGLRVRENNVPKASRSSPPAPAK